MKKTVMPKLAAPVERNSPATAAGAGAEKEGVVPSNKFFGPEYPFAGDDAE